MKRCTHCRTMKPKADFYRNASKPDGHADECKSCFNALREYDAATETVKIQRLLKERW